MLQVLSAAWQMFSSGHSAHFGRRAMHSLRPCQMIWWENSVHFSRGMILHQVLFDCLGVVIAGEFEAAADAVDVRVHHYAFVLLEPRAQHYVGSLSRYPRQSEKLVHLDREPGRRNRSTIFLAAPTTDFDLFRKKPVERTSGWSCSGSSAAKS